jgi:hypothetical protein
MGIDAGLYMPFDEQIEFFRGKVNIPTERWDDLVKEQHARGFMVAGANRNAIVSDFRVAVDKAIAKGTTLEEFRKDFDRIVETHGWQYKGGRNWRSRVIYDTNTRQSYNTGRYKQMMDPDVLAYRPYHRYRHGDSRHPRPLHLSWDGLVLRADDPWWATHRPMNGWGCKCGVDALSERDLARLGKTGPDEAPPSPIDPKTGTPVGIDKGFDYDPGKAAWGENQAKRLMESEGKWVDLHPWGPERYGRSEKIAVIDTPKAELGRQAKQGDKEGLRAMLREAVGGDSVFLKDPIGGQVCVNQAIADHIAEASKRWDGREAYFPLIPELIQDPYEIWLNFAQNEVSGRVAVRKKYVKAVRISKNLVIGLFAEEQDGLWVSGTFFRGGLTGAGNLRKGRLLYARD